MSNIYIQEPPTNGKVLLVTSVGDIDVELWSKEAPKACRNFVQLCMENYYDDTIFHRIVKGFIVQGGDPTGNGLGGESIYGKEFKDEFHQRLRFNRRGLLGMANTGPNTNGSQFFFTLDAADELTKKHTVFGKVGGNTIYNMIRMADIETDKDDRPEDPPKIFKTEILYNPFDDIEPRKKKKEEGEEKEHKEKKNKKAPKNFKLLSFGEEAEEDEVESTEISKTMAIQSSHDLLKDPKLSSESALELTKDGHPTEESVTDRIREKLTKNTEARKRKLSSSSEDDEDKKKRERTKALKDEAKKIKREMAEQKHKKEESKIEPEQEATKEEDKSATNDLMKELKEQRQQFIRQKKENSMLKKGGKRENETLALLAGFENQLSHAKDEGLPSQPEPTENEQTTEQDGGWMSHTLTFEEDLVKAKDANIQNADTFDIIDPRNPITQRRKEASKQKLARSKRR